MPSLVGSEMCIRDRSNAFEATSGARSFASSRITRRSKALAKWEIKMRESSGDSSFSSRSTTPSSTARAAPTEMPISCHVCQSLLRNTTALELAASPPRNMAASSSSSLWTLHPFLYDPRCWLEWAGTSPRERCFGGLPFASSDFRDFRAHGPRMRIDDLSASNERFIARVTATVTIDDCRSGRGEMFPAAGTVFASVFTLSLIHI